jgi:hypothetical protein
MMLNKYYWKEDRIVYTIEVLTRELAAIELSLRGEKNSLERAFKLVKDRSEGIEIYEQRIIEIKNVLDSLGGVETDYRVGQ